MDEGDDGSALSGRGPPGRDLRRDAAGSPARLHVRIQPHVRLHGPDHCRRRRGGRPAAVATALCSALSLDFLLTKPYLRLTIEEKHDVIAFVGLAVCGLIAGTLGPEGGERRTLRAERAHRELLPLTLTQLDAAGPLESRVARILNASRAAPPLSPPLHRDRPG